MAIWTQADIDRLKAAVAEGVLSVSYAGPPARAVTYQSLDAMRSLLREMVTAVHDTPSSTLVAYSKGFDRS